MAGQSPKRPPAPEALRAVQLFVNTWDREGRREGLRSPDDLRRWLADHGLAAPDAAVTADDLHRAVAIREALRALVLANNGAPLDRSALAAADDAVRRFGIGLAVGATGALELTAPTPVGRAMAALVGAVQAAMADGRWARMKACQLDECQWVFYDSSRNRHGRWCTMTVCGSRVRSRRAYRRRRDAEPAP